MTAPTIYLKAYQPPAFTVLTVNLTFELYEDHALVHNHMHLKRQHPGALQLHGESLVLVSIHQDNQPLSAEHYQLDANTLLLNTALDELRLTIVTRIYPRNNTELSGLYCSNNLFCTQCEAEGFRRITYYLDRPDVLAVYTTKIIADKARYPVLLSNGNLQDSGLAEEGRHWAVWQDPYPKPSYLFALVAGDLACIEDEFITCTQVKVALRLYVEPGNEDQCGHALASLKRAMHWDEERYGRIYDLSVYMIVAVSDFNMGAMENKGLNIFNSKFILARPDTATDEDYANIESVVAHEYFHNWTGNRVTCRDWFQLSLKEGLTVFRDQEFSRDMHSRDVNRILDVKLLRTIQFPEDAGCMAHPVRPESYQEISNFYTATVYEKGAEVIRMQYLLLGAEGFRRGTDLYFERHDGTAVTIDDFVAAMEDANGVDLSQFKRWYSQAGTPVVTVKTTYQEGRLLLTFNQSCPPTSATPQPLPFYIPIQMALFNTDGQRLENAPSLVVLQQKEDVIEISGLSSKPLVSLLRECSAPVKIIRDVTLDEQLGLMRYETDGFAKWDAAQQLMRTAVTFYYHGDHASCITYATQIVSMLNELLRHEQLDPALCAELLTPPSFEDMASGIPEVDVDGLEDARLVFVRFLSEGLYPNLQRLYVESALRIEQVEPSMAYGWRQLRMRCLRLMLHANESATLPLCRRLMSAETMTEQLSGFEGLAHSWDKAARREACVEFYQRWAQDELVLDKWFRVQATADRPDTLTEVRHLLKHPAFHNQNPNRVRALIGSFVQGNPRQFHALSGEGYQFLTEQLLILDAINAQMAARLAVPYTRWQRLDKRRQSLIQKELRHLAVQSISKELAELVNKSVSMDHNA